MTRTRKTTKKISEYLDRKSLLDYSESVRIRVYFEGKSCSMDLLVKLSSSKMTIKHLTRH